MVTYPLTYNKNLVSQTQMEVYFFMNAAPACRYLKLVRDSLDPGCALRPPPPIATSLDLAETNTRLSQDIKLHLVGSMPLLVAALDAGIQNRLSPAEQYASQVHTHLRSQPESRTDCHPQSSTPLRYTPTSDHSRSPEQTVTHRAVRLSGTHPPQITAGVQTDCHPQSSTPLRYTPTSDHSRSPEQTVRSQPESRTDCHPQSSTPLRYTPTSDHSRSPEQTVTHHSRSPEQTVTHREQYASQVHTHLRSQPESRTDVFAA